MNYDKGMSQQIGQLLGGKNYGEPPEIKQIKEFVRKEIGLTPQISITAETYVIAVSSAAAAGSLRSSLFRLQKQLNTEKRLLIRIG